MMSITNNGHVFLSCIHAACFNLSERLVRGTVDALSGSSFSAAGFRFLSLGDCWMSRSRDERGRLQPDPRRFPSGMRDLAAYVSLHHLLTDSMISVAKQHHVQCENSSSKEHNVASCKLCSPGQRTLLHSVQCLCRDSKNVLLQVHSKGLKLGVYLDTGNLTCNGFPGSQGHLQLDAETLTDWRLDMVKLNGCNTQDPRDYDTGMLCRQTAPSISVNDFSLFSTKAVQKKN